MSRRWQRNKRDRQYRSIYADLPSRACEVRTHAFGDWVRRKGGTCVRTTNQYEVARWQSGAGRHDVGVIYCKADGTLTWTPSSADDYRAFMRESGI